MSNPGTHHRREGLAIHKVVAGAAACAGAAVAVGALTAAAVRFGGLAHDVRDALAFEFLPWEPSVARAVGIAAHNFRLALAVFLVALGVSRVHPRLRTFIDVLLSAAWLHNAALVGAAWGAYGGRIAAAIAPHLPVELAAMSLAAGVYVSGRRAPIMPCALLAPTVACAVLLGLGGWLETYARVPGP